MHMCTLLTSIFYIISNQTIISLTTQFRSRVCAIQIFRQKPPLFDKFKGLFRLFKSVDMVTVMKTGILEFNKNSTHLLTDWLTDWLTDLWHSDCSQNWKSGIWQWNWYWPEPDSLTVTMRHSNLESDDSSFNKALGHTNYCYF